MGFIDVAKSVGGWTGARVKNVAWDLPKWGLNKTGSAASGTARLTGRTARRVGSALNPYESQDKVPSQSYEQMNIVSRAVSRILVDGTRLATFGTTFSREMNEKIWGDKDIQAMLMAINRLVLNFGVSVIDAGGPLGELVSWLVSAGAITKNKHSLLPNIKRSHIIATEAADLGTVGLLSSHTIVSSFQTLRDLPIITKGMLKLMKYIGQDKMASLRQVGSAINTFGIQPAKKGLKVVTTPVRWPAQKIHKLFKGTGKKTQNIANKILGSGSPATA